MTDVYINTNANAGNQQVADNNSDPTQDIGNETSGQWIAVHNNQIINFYGSQQDASDGLKAYQMDNVIDINDNIGVYQII